MPGEEGAHVGDCSWDSVDGLDGGMERGCDVWVAMFGFRGTHWCRSAICD